MSKTENESDEVPQAAKQQKENVSIDELLKAYLYYYDNDAFIEWKL